MAMEAAEHDDGMNRHGFPQGTNFAPKRPELVELLAERLAAGGPLPGPLGDVFTEDVLDAHPRKLYQQYKEKMEMGTYIYFFGPRTPRPGSETKAVRRVPTGWWKSSGSGNAVKTAGGLVGQKHTLVYYEESGKKTNWAMNEFTLTLPDGTIAGTAVYRLYIMKKGYGRKGKEKGGGGQAQSSIAEDASDEPFAGAAGEAVWPALNYPPLQQQPRVAQAAGISGEIALPVKDGGVSKLHWADELCENLDLFEDLLNFPVEVLLSDATALDGGGESGGAAHGDGSGQPQDAAN